MGADRKIGIITQARTTSTRLPNKVLLEIKGKTILQYHLDRLKKSGFPFFVATTVNETDNAIAEFCEFNKIPYYRGSEQDVLSRYYESAVKFKLDIVVRVTSDCPLIDGELIKEGIKEYISQPGENYVSNCIERTYPRGFDFEIFSFKSLEEAFKNGSSDSEREHVTPYIRDVHKNTGINLVHLKRAQDASGFRITLDEADDLILIKKLIEDFDADKKSGDEIINILSENKKLNALNSHVEQKKI